MQVRHSDQDLYFKEQSLSTRDHVLPFIRESVALDQDSVVAEIGCSIGGGMQPFLDIGCKMYGFDINEKAIAKAKSMYDGDGTRNKPVLLAGDIYDVAPPAVPEFDLIVMRDVLEHIHDQERFIGHLYSLIKPGGVVFISFPPISMPFGGHQQICVNKFASRLPYYHLLPRRIYAGLLRAFGETEGRIVDLLEIKETGLPLWKFHRMIKRSDFKIIRELRYLINPNYQVKFGLKPRKLPLLMDVPRLREFFMTTSYILLKK